MRSRLLANRVKNFPLEASFSAFPLSRSSGLYARTLHLFLLHLVFFFLTPDPPVPVLGMYNSLMETNLPLSFACSVRRFLPSHLQHPPLPPSSNSPSFDAPAHTDWFCFRVFKHAFCLVPFPALWPSEIFLLEPASPVSTQLSLSLPVFLCSPLQPPIQL